MMIEAEGDSRAALDWDLVDLTTSLQLDRHRVTEDAAEAVALVLVWIARQWVVEKRLQRWQSADWLLVAPNGERIAMEVSGIDGSFDRRRLREKLRQVGAVKFCEQRFASVVAFAEPTAALARA